MAKYRQGFVTNSSSSSFIIAFDNIPKEVEEVKKLLFDKDQVAYSGYYTTECFNLDSVANSILEKIKNAKVNNKEELDNALSGYFEDAPAPDYLDYIRNFKYGTDEYKEAYERYLRDDHKFRMEKLKEFKKQNKKKKLVAISCSDGDGPMESAMEHGALFRHLPHLKISHH